MLRQVSQLGQRALGFPEKEPETSLFLGKEEKTKYFECGFC